MVEERDGERVVRAELVSPIDTILRRRPTGSVASTAGRGARTTRSHLARDREKAALRDVELALAAKTAAATAAQAAAATAATAVGVERAAHAARDVHRNRDRKARELERVRREAAPIVPSGRLTREFEIGEIGAGADGLAVGRVGATHERSRPRRWCL